MQPYAVITETPVRNQNKHFIIRERPKGKAEEGGFLARRIFYLFFFPVIMQVDLRAGVPTLVACVGQQRPPLIIGDYDVFIGAIGGMENRREGGGQTDEPLREVMGEGRQMGSNGGGKFDHVGKDVGGLIDSATNLNRSVTVDRVLSSSIRHFSNRMKCKYRVVQIEFLFGKYIATTKMAD